jgi:hypothetical protein
MYDRTEQTLWESATPIFGFDRNYWRQDHRGRVISRWAFGLRSHPNGWEKGHIIAAADGGSDMIWNLQAEHWRTNLEKEEERQKRERERQQANSFMGLLSSTLDDEYRARSLFTQSHPDQDFNGLGLSALRPYLSPPPASKPSGSLLPRFGASPQTPFMGGLRREDFLGGL